LRRISFAFLDRVAAFLRNVRGWRRAAIALGTGAVATLAFAPFYAFPVLLIAYGVLVLLFDGAAMQERRAREGAILGWSFGFGFFFAGLYWVGYAFLVDSDRHAWLLPFLAVTLPGGLALFFAGAGSLAAMLWRDNWQRIFLFAALFFASDWLRGHVLSGFPWHLPAYGWGALPSVLQTASIAGAYGLSILTLLFGASLALVFDKKRQPNFAIVMALIFAVASAWGALRLGGNDNATVAGVNLRIVQPSTPQSEKYDPDYTSRNWRRLMDLSRAPAAKPVTHILWPEAAPPMWWLDRQKAALAEIAELLGSDKYLLTGATRLELEAGAPSYFNSFHTFGPGGRILATYDKFHLVPFGEYLPFETLLKAVGVTQIAGGSSSFSAGPGPRTLKVPGVPPFGPLICYEVIFPREVVGKERPDWLLNLTDDSWFGPDAGPEQHLLIARVRAIEEGLPIVRAANSGISGVIDSYGELRAHLGLNERSHLDVSLPAKLPPTVYARVGNIVVGFLFLLCFGAALWPLSTRKP
jgi:apolipoprotein N-acyltransferase